MRDVKRKLETVRRESRKRREKKIRDSRAYSEMWVNAAKERKLGHAQLCWCVYGSFADEEN